MCVVSSPIDIIESFYERHTIYKCLLICHDDESLNRLTVSLRNQNHQVQTFEPRFNISSDDESIYRVTAMTVATLNEHESMVERNVLCDHNLVIIDVMDDSMVEDVVDWVDDAYRRGYKPRDLQTHILYLGGQ